MVPLMLGQAQRRGLVARVPPTKWLDARTAQTSRGGACSPSDHSQASGRVAVFGAEC